MVESVKNNFKSSFFQHRLQNVFDMFFPYSLNTNYKNKIVKKKIILAEISTKCSVKQLRKIFGIPFLFSTIFYFSKFSLEHRDVHVPIS